MTLSVAEDAHGARDLSGITTQLLQQELLRRRDEDTERPVCGSGPRGSYNTGLHVFALFLILVLSIVACAFPIAARRFPKLPIPHRFLFLSRHFGTGVLIATAFVHLLPTAFVSLTDPCLPAFWTEDYPAMPGFIAMVSVFVVVSIEMFFATKGAGHVHGDYAELNEGTGTGEEERAPLYNQVGSMQNVRMGKTPKSGGIRHFRTGSMNGQDEIGSEGGFMASHAASSGGLDLEARKRSSDDEDSSDVDLDDFDDVADALQPAAGSSRALSPKSNPPRYNETLQSSGGEGAQSPDAAREEQRMVLQCMLLEAGILFHSVFIGMALSVATGTPFVVLLIAISFHQTFEGLALGSRIAAIPSFGPTSLKPWLMALAYGTTTPIGQAIGLGVHNLYDPESQVGLLTVGVMNAISSGLLLFAGLVELLAEDFLSEKSYGTLQGRSRIQACAAVFAGSMLMALVGAFA